MMGESEGWLIKYGGRIVWEMYGIIWWEMDEQYGGRWMEEIGG